MKTVKTILNVLVVMLLLPIFVSLTTGVACANMVKGEALSLLFVERTVLTTIKILKSTLDLGVQIVRHAKDLISLIISSAWGLVKYVVKAGSFVVINGLKLVKKLASSLVKPFASFVSNVKTNVTNRCQQIGAFTRSMIAFASMSQLMTHSMNQSEIKEELSQTELNDVQINLELELTDELAKLLKLNSEAPTLKASLTISKEVAVSLLKSLTPQQVATA